MFINKNIYIYSFIFLISLLYSLLVGSGTLGFGVDYYRAYIFPNQSSPQIWDTIGWTLATLSINKIHLGVYIVSFIISLSCGFLILLFFRIQSLNSLLIFFIFFIFTIFSWPAIVSANNALRQGLAMSFIFFSLYYLFYNCKLLSIIFIIIATFSHKSGIGFILNFIYLYIFFFFSKKIIFSRTMLFLCGILYFIIYFFITINLKTNKYADNIVISLDFTWIFLLINTIFIFFFTLRYKFLKNPIILFLYFFNFAALSTYASGLYWQYERFNMIMIIAIILSLSTIFSKNSKYIYLLTAVTLLLILTFFTGMYTVGKGIWLQELG
jgi:hypothetical protein